MAIVGAVLAAVFIGIYIAVHRLRVKTMRRYIERGGLGGADREDSR